MILFGIEPRRSEPPGKRWLVQLSAQTLGDSAVHFFPVANLHDINEMLRIVDGVHDPVATLPEAVPVALSSELLTSTRARLRR